MSQSFSRRYPPKNRKARQLPVLRIEIEDDIILKTFNPNSLVLACYAGEHKNWKPIPNLNSEMSPVPAKGPVPIRGAIRYRSRTSSTFWPIATASSSRYTTIITTRKAEKRCSPKASRETEELAAD